MRAVSSCICPRRITAAVTFNPLSPAARTAYCFFALLEFLVRMYSLCASLSRRCCCRDARTDLSPVHIHHAQRLHHVAAHSHGASATSSGPSPAQMSAHRLPRGAAGSAAVAAPPAATATLGTHRLPSAAGPASMCIRAVCGGPFFLRCSEHQSRTTISILHHVC